MEFVEELSWNRINSQSLKLNGNLNVNFVMLSSSIVNDTFFKYVSDEILIRIPKGGVVGFNLKTNEGFTRGWETTQKHDDKRGLALDLSASPKREFLDGVYAWPAMAVVSGPVWNDFQLTGKTDSLSELWGYVLRNRVPVTEIWDSYVVMANMSSVTLEDVKPDINYLFGNLAVDLVDDNDEKIEERVGQLAWKKQLHVGLIVRQDLSPSWLINGRGLFDYVMIMGPDFNWNSQLRDNPVHCWLIADKDLKLSRACDMLDCYLSHRHLDALFDPDSDSCVIHGNMVRWSSEKLNSNVSLADWTRRRASSDRCLVGDMQGLHVGVETENHPCCWPDKWPMRRRIKGLKVAVLSMCGVSSFEDKYGLGGEHQVVHWLREDMLNDERVVECDVFDTYNIKTMLPGYYDIIFSNSCWVPAPRTVKGGLTIFWHFNTNSNAMSIPADIAGLGYDYIWTNSRSQFPDLDKLMNGRCRMVDLNASSRHHFPVNYSTSCFEHDVCYIGGYQPYKGKDRIDLFTKPLMGQNDFEFVIYGNRLWMYKKQEEALEIDSQFTHEFLDKSFESYYRGVVHPDDFRHLAKSTKIWINFNASDQYVIDMVNDRPIWALACGAFVITDDTPAQRAVYGDVVDYSTGGIDLLEKVRYWLAHPEERTEKASRGPELIRKLNLMTRDTVNKILAEYEGWRKQA